MRKRKSFRLPPVALAGRTEPHPEKSPLRGKTSVSSFESRTLTATRFAKICFPSARVGLAAEISLWISTDGTGTQSAKRAFQRLAQKHWRQRLWTTKWRRHRRCCLLQPQVNKVVVFFSRHSSSRRLVRNERACTWKGPSGRVDPRGRFVGESTSESARSFGSRAQRRTARRRASIVGVFSSPESLGPPRRLLSPSADEAREAYNHGRAPAGAPQHSQDV